jgi:enoyl-CoA hydratase/carnithine racemase
LYSQASELLYFSNRITAQEAYSSGLVSAVFPHDKFEELAWAKIKAMSQLPIKVTKDIGSIQHFAFENLNKLS